ncbi:MAG TPA: phosphoglucomutase, partial [Terriglobia bacterium]|nr:phosphoglucomutase [Terriglobia bacterium]
MRHHPEAGQPAKPSDLVNLPRLITAFYTRHPDASLPAQRVSFGTSGHRGTAFENSFNEDHILAISQAIANYRRRQGIDGPLFLAKDTHALSEPAFVSALEVLAANEVEVMIDQDDGYTPTPALSHAILTYNRGRKRGLADGIVITPSHNPPEDGGFKYNPPEGGPADTSVTSAIQDEANALLATGLREIRKSAYERALRSPTTHRYDFISAYVNDLTCVLDMEAIRGAQLNIGVDPLGGAGVCYWARINERYGLSLNVVNPVVD